jgi:hypothetical protein
MGKNKRGLSTLDPNVVKRRAVENEEELPL